MKLVNSPPKRPGLYRIADGHRGTQRWSYWDGKRFNWCSSSRVRAFANRDEPSEVLGPDFVAHYPESFAKHLPGADKPTRAAKILLT